MKRSKTIIICMLFPLLLAQKVNGQEKNFASIESSLTKNEVQDFKGWVALGEGGLPHSLDGYRRLQNLTKKMGNPFNVNYLEGLVNRGNDISTLKSLPSRTGNRPKIAPYAIPHRQITELNKGNIRTLQSKILERLVNNNAQDLEFRTSYFEKHNKGIFLKNSSGGNRRFFEVTHSEVGHMHPTDGSMHITLSPSDAKEVISKGWSEFHGLHGQKINDQDALSDTYIMLYAPRNQKELDAVEQIFKAAIQYFNQNKNIEQKMNSEKLTEIAHSDNYVWNGAVKAPNGRLFASMPCWLGPTPGVVEVFEDGSFRPYPGGVINEWQRDKDPLKSFVDINSIFIDKNNHMWVNDAAAPDFGKAMAGAIKVMEIDLTTDQVVRTIVFDPKIVGSDTRLAHIRIWNDFAILAESKSGSFIIIDLKDNSYRRILTGNKEYMLCQPGEVPVIEGRKMRHNDGRDMYINNDLLEFGKDPDTLYFICLFGSKIFKVDAGILTDKTLSEDEILKNISIAYDLKGTWVAGICRGNEGEFYLTDAENNGVSVLYPNGTIKKIVSDPEIIWPIAPSFDKEHYLYFTNTQLNRFPLLNDGKNTVKKPWKMWKIKVK